MPKLTKEIFIKKIAEDFGVAFLMGCIGGGFFQAIKGFRNAPSGLNRRLLYSVAAIKERTPLIAGNFAIWGGTFNAIDYTLAHIRKKNDPWNSIWSGVATGGVLAARKDKFSIVNNAIISGILMAIVESASIALAHLNMKDSDHSLLAEKNN